MLTRPDESNRTFEQKRILVTGAASGFGAAIAQAFGRRGGLVVVADIDGKGAERIAQQIRSAIAVQVDLTSEEQVNTMAAEMVRAWGGIDIVCANAGGPHRSMNLIDLSSDEFDRVFALNVRSVFLTVKACVPNMPSGGSIVTTASIGAIRPRPRQTAYNASKGAVVTMTRGLAAELAPHIRVNCVLPVSAPTGFDRQAMGVESMPADVEREVIKSIPLGRRAQAADVANSVLFLASDSANFLTGVCLNVDGGRSI